MSTKAKSQYIARTRRRARIKARIRGTAERPRIAVFRSAKHIYAQLIDDASKKTIASARDTELKKSELKAEGMEAKTAAAFAVGQSLAERAKKAGVKAAVFDRGGYVYHGRVKALADGARAGGLEF
jgi:large subunit ribosomal protein L18